MRSFARVVSVSVSVSTACAFAVWERPGEEDKAVWGRDVGGNMEEEGKREAVSVCEGFGEGKTEDGNVEVRKSVSRKV